MELRAGDTVGGIQLYNMPNTTELICIVTKTFDIFLFFHSTNNVFAVTTCDILC